MAAHGSMDTVIERFNTFLIASNIKDPSRKRAYSVVHVNACVCFGFTRGQLGTEKDRRGDRIKPHGDRSEERKESLKELY